MNSFAQDIRYAVRMLLRSPGFLLVAVLSLGLGMGANTAIFSLIHVVMLQSLPVAHPNELVALTDPAVGGVEADTREHGTRELLSYYEFQELRARDRVLAGLFAAQSEPVRGEVFPSGLSGSAQARTQLVSKNFFGVLGLRPALGHYFTASEDRSDGGAPVAVISHSFWQNALGSDPAVIGKSLRVGQADLQIVGVAAAGFRGIVLGSDTDIWAPLTMQLQMIPGRDYLTPHDTLWLQVMGRRKPGMSLAQTNAALNVEWQNILRAWAAPLPTEKERRELLSQNLKVQSAGRGASELRDQFSDPLLLLMVMVGLVLLIACANIANLVLARASARQREFGVRAALGARRSRLLRQMLTESLVLAALGAAVGLLMAHWGAKLLVVLVASGTTPVDIHPGVDSGVLVFTAGVAVLTAIVFGLVPAMRASRADVNSTFAAGVRGSQAGQGRVRPGRVLVVAQVALSLLLLVSAALFVRSFGKMLAANLGFARDHLLSARLEPLAAGYRRAAFPALYQQIIAAVKRIPGVRGVTLSGDGLFDGDSVDPVSMEGSPIRNPADLHARWTLIGPEYFGTLGIPLLRGRELSSSDAAQALPYCVVNRAFADFYFPQGDPIGKHVTDEYPTTRETYQIVGVVADAREHDIREKSHPRFYANLLHPIGAAGDDVSVILRTSGASDPVANELRKAIRRIDPHLPITDIQTVNEQLDRRLVTERLVAQLSAFFGGLALVMAAIGLYGVMSYSTARRTSEIGVRMALGASESSVLWMVLKETLGLLGIGILIGFPLAIIAGRLLANRLFGLSPTDPAALSIAVIIISATALLAGYLPARRAARISPVTALRYD